MENLENRDLLTTFLVDSLDDSGAGTLRQAIEDANAESGADVIDFAVTGTVQLTSGALPAITDTVNLDGTSAPGFSGAALVEVDANGFEGLIFETGSAGSTLRSLGFINAGGDGVTFNEGQILVVGNYISSNAGNGVVIDGASNIELIANFIGTDVSGNLVRGNAGNGILLVGGASSNVIGGTTPLAVSPVPDQYQGKPIDGNVISGNGQNGVLLTDGAENNLLAGNFIGTDLSGNSPIGNSLDGVAIVNGSHNNSLLGADFTPPTNEDPFVYYNVVSGNGQNGLRIDDSNNTIVQANFFGAGADNSTRVGNALNGVLIEGSSDGTVFGGVIPLGNVSAANGQHGVEIRDTVSNTIAFNTFAGLGAFNTSTDLGNLQDGFHITSTGKNNVLRTNVISGNHDDGIEISGNARGVIIDKAIIGMITNGMDQTLPNLDNGVEIGGNASHNSIGGLDLSVITKTTISGNGNHGVAILGEAHHNQVFNSFIGTDILGSTGFGNGGDGIFLGDDTSHNTIGGTNSSNCDKIGGTDSGDCNLISGNGGSGVELAGGSHHNDILFNHIGSNIDGDGGLGNAGAGILLGSGTHHNTINGNISITNGGVGFFLNGSNHNMLTDNSAVENASDGFRLENSDFNLLKSNTATDNAGDGFDVENSNHNKFLDNLSEQNDEYGFLVDEAFANLFK